jgi:hypothetical protein
MVNQDERRFFVRIPVSFPLKFSLTGSSLQCIGTVSDVSIRGLGIFTETSLSRGASLDCWLLLSDKNRPFYTKGEVIWTIQEGGKTLRVGISLSNPVTTGVAHVLRQNS